MRSFFGIGYRLGLSFLVAFSLGKDNGFLVRTTLTYAVYENAHLRIVCGTEYHLLA